MKIIKVVPGDAGGYRCEVTAKDKCDSCTFEISVESEWKQAVHSLYQIQTSHEFLELLSPQLPNRRHRPIFCLRSRERKYAEVCVSQAHVQNIGWRLNIDVQTIYVVRVGAYLFSAKLVCINAGGENMWYAWSWFPSAFNTCLFPCAQWCWRGWGRPGFQCSAKGNKEVRRFCKLKKNQ